jgi:hypothetical protein
MSAEPTIEPTFFEAFKDNPFAFLIAIALGAAGFALFVVAVASAIKRKRAAMVVGVGAALLGGATIAVGVYGTVTARAATDAALAAPGLSGNDQERIRKHGYGLAIYALFTGLALGGLPLVGGALATVAGRARSRKQGASL